jgi:hypothetical protein
MIEILLTFFLLLFNLLFYGLIYAVRLRFEIDSGTSPTIIDMLVLLKL